ncbi:hypothetical protein G6M89_17000 [Natronolimnobius sp. AArcel1]|uniref:hypothetical protein n=1 Tax=Natronolimnobius sp. AArcel1 TaxID=1679093 RepID=UPI0013EB137E|nr:hypothetical protein [Natronolimnobius sp. AArcel1]NGM70683.1 hypothetical protein [Natronolimnobius sp. AArcel1]
MSRPTRQVLALSILITLVTLVAGCSGLVPGFEDTESDIEQDALISHADDVDSYTMETTRTLQAPTVTENTTLEATVDRTSHSAQLLSTTETDVGDGPQTETTEQYIDDGVQYTNEDDNWDTTSFDNESDWEQLDQLETAVGTLEDADLEQIRTESIDGTETTMYEVNVSDDQYATLAGLESQEQQHVQTGVEQLVYYVYIDTERDELRGTDLRMEVTQGDGSALVTTQTIFGAFDDTPSISAPDAAEAALEG